MGEEKHQIEQSIKEDIEKLKQYKESIKYDEEQIDNIDKQLADLEGKTDDKSNEERAHLEARKQTLVADRDDLDNKCGLLEFTTLTDKTTRIGELKDELDTKNEEYNTFKEQKTSELDTLKTEFKDASEKYLESAEKVKENLENRNIFVDFKGRKKEEVIKDDDQIITPNSDTAQQPKAQQQQTQQQAPQQQAAQQQEAQQQATQQVESAVPVITGDNTERLSSAVGNVVAEGDIWDRLGDAQQYEYIMKNLDDISRNPQKLSRRQKKELKNAFMRNKQKAIIDMQKGLTDDEIESLREIIGDDIDVIREEIEGKGSLVQDSTNGFAGVDYETKAALLDATNKYYERLRTNDDISDETKAIFESRILKPLRFAAAERECGKLTQNRFFRFFKDIGNKKLVNELNNTLKNISVESRGKITEERKVEDNSPEVDVPEIEEVVKNEPKQEMSFRDFLKDNLNDLSEIDIEGSVGETKLNRSRDKNKDSRII